MKKNYDKSANCGELQANCGEKKSNVFKILKVKKNLVFTDLKKKFNDWIINENKKPT